MINQKELSLGIELGSTRIKSVLIDKNAKVIAKGGFEWKNILVDGLWSYPLEEAVKGLKESYRELACNFFEKTGEKLTQIGFIGVSAMMHGYLALDSDDKLLAPFRTWRNTNTGAAAEELSDLFNFNIPMRWSVAQYYQSVLDNLSHVKNISFLTTLSGYIHYLLTGQKVLGIDDASGMFPVSGNDYDKDMMTKFNSLIVSKGINVDFYSILPKVLVAGQNAGILTENGAKLLDESGELQAGSVFCPPEGDMGTGIVATNSVAVRYANISCGTSGNLTVVLERPLKNRYREIDVVATPDGNPCALIHTNNCCTEIDEWANLFREVLSLYGIEATKGQMLDKLFDISSKSDCDVGKIFGYNYLAGETIAGTEKGLPVIGRMPDGNLNLANFSQMQIYSAIAVIALGVDLLKKEDVKIDTVYAHGGFYKSENVGQIATSAALGGVGVTVAETAGEGGAWGIALLALYMDNTDISLPQFLNQIFGDVKTKTLCAGAEQLQKFNNFINEYKKFLPAEKYATNI